MSYVGQKPFDPVTLDIRVSSGAEFTIYDDDERAKTQEIVTCKADKSKRETVLQLSPSGKTYVATFHAMSRPAKVTLNGADMRRLGSRAELEGAVAGWYFEGPATLLVKFAGQGRKNEVIVR
jgi:hypothetical protein